MTNFVIDVKQLSKSFSGHPAVVNVDFQVKRGDIVGFLGPNGSGKTTTIRMMCGLLTPDKGSGFCLGYDILREVSQIKKHVGYMTQYFSLYKDLSVEENLFFVARVFALNNIKQRVENCLQDWELASRRKQLAGTLSGGWRQRLALAAAMIHEPQLLLLDEPTAGIDPKARREFWQQLRDLAARGITTLVSTHYMDEAIRCDQLAYIAFGHILVHGTAADILRAANLPASASLEDAFIELVSQQGS
jgi:ABC-2 type transport system ATP-binding protein